MKKRQYISLVVVLWIVFFVAVGCDFENYSDRPFSLFSPQKITEKPKIAESKQVSPEASSQQTLVPKATNVPESTQNNNSPILDEKKLEDEGNGKIICIDPGHQKKGNTSKEALYPNSTIMKDKTTSGTSGISSKTPEYVINMSVAKKLKENLEKKGYKVVMTRESNDVNLSNIERAKIANDSKADLSIRIHADGSTNSSVKGISILVPSPKYIKDKEMLNKSKEAGTKILKKTIETTAAISRGVVERDDMTGFNWAKVPTVLIEMGFLSNKEEDKLLNTDLYQEKIAEGMVLGVREYFKK